MSVMDMSVIDMSVIDMSVMDMSVIDMSIIDMSVIDMSIIDMSAIDMSVMDMSFLDTSCSSALRAFLQLALGLRPSLVFKANTFSNHMPVYLNIVKCNESLTKIIHPLSFSLDQLNYSLR